jgi:hypothetical protein
VRHVAAPHEARRAVVRDPDGRNRILDDIRNKTDWPNFYRNAGSPDRVMPVSFNKPLHVGQTATSASARRRFPRTSRLRLSTCTPATLSVLIAFIRSPVP